VNDVPSIDPRSSCIRGILIDIHINNHRVNTASKSSQLRPSNSTPSLENASISTWVPCSHCPCWLFPAWELYVFCLVHTDCTPLMDILATHFRRLMLRRSYVFCGLQCMWEIPEQVRLYTLDTFRKLLLTWLLVWPLE
jgi:hypothetical protein